MEQMSLFDFVNVEDMPLDDLPENEMVRQIGLSTGLEFKYNDFLETYQAKVKGVTFSVKYSKYSVEPYTRFIGCSWDTKTQGCSAPVDSLDGAVRFFKKAIARFSE